MLPILLQIPFYSWNIKTTTKNNPCITADWSTMVRDPNWANQILTRSFQIELEEELLSLLGANIVLGVPGDSGSGSAVLWQHKQSRGLDRGRSRPVNILAPGPSLCSKHRQFCITSSTQLYVTHKQASQLVHTSTLFSNCSPNLWTQENLQP